ncbi:ABC transporter substrate-binding protein [Flavihumibacter sp. UBA7668]|uniref:ABC transporter substrate-binding protein n=1 Tax=Flavihumibacter sp. UBA7668 TaxID=1946542 RepID=UPI0025B8B9D6|nr:ABC transporter substrate-binding protein [Flavihumibacter sp. UBA7668]
MSSSTQLKGITWDHPRGYQPLEAISDQYQKLTGIKVTWSRRSLKEFGDTPVEELAARFDLIVLDHPYMGQAHSNKLLVNLTDHLEPSFLQEQERLSVGPSFASYRYNGNLYALPVDAAAMVAAYNKGAFENATFGFPTKLENLQEFSERLPVGKKIAIALCPTDCWCVFLTLCAQDSNGEVFSSKGVRTEPATKALLMLKEWQSFLHPASCEMNAIQLLDHMSTTEEIVYTPFVFGYTNYARTGFRKLLLHFDNVPKLQGSRYSSVLGGAGIAVSGQSTRTTEAIAFLKYLLNPPVYKSHYVKNGGQSAHVTDWVNESANFLCHGFFINTIKTLQQAYLRPRVPGFNVFQEKAADIVFEHITSSRSIASTIESINKLYNEHCHQETHLH